MVYKSKLITKYHVLLDLTVNKLRHLLHMAHLHHGIEMLINVLIPYYVIRLWTREALTILTWFSFPHVILCVTSLIALICCLHSLFFVSAEQSQPWNKIKLLFSTYITYCCQFLLKLCTTYTSSALIETACWCISKLRDNILPGDSLTFNK